MKVFAFFLVKEDAHVIGRFMLIESGIWWKYADSSCGVKCDMEIQLGVSSDRKRLVLWFAFNLGWLIVIGRCGWFEERWKKNIKKENCLFLKLLGSFSKSWNFVRINKLLKQALKTCGVSEEVENFTERGTECFLKYWS